PEKLRRLAIATTAGSRCAASGETISPVALRAPSATVSPEEPDNSFKEDFSNEVMCMSYLYSKLPETGVPHRIGTGGKPAKWSNLRWRVALHILSSGSARLRTRILRRREVTLLSLGRTSRCARGRYVGISDRPLYCDLDLPVL